MQSVITLYIQRWRYNPSALRILETNDSSNFQEWQTDSVFYAFTPLLRPIPEGMACFEIKHAGTWPNAFTKIVPVVDFFGLDDTSTYFIAYTKKVNGTTKLRLPSGMSSDIYVLDSPIDSFVCNSDLDLCVPSQGKKGKEFSKCVFDCSICWACKD